ncbi:MAG: formylglycine-generating enzyme family protein, partial [Sediminibacterium sp.]|nr:formylglycine-generating enzyme family protein [Sediminibacterium sp.]
ITTATANITITNPNGLTISNAGVCYSNSNNLPTINNSTQALNSGALAGNYNLALSGLTASTTYYVRGYVNFNGTYYYGGVLTFTTANLATVITNNITNITYTSATASLSITNNNNANITMAGFCYSKTNTTPTNTDSVKTITNTGILNGTYTITINSFISGSSYYVRAFIVIGGNYIYSTNVVSFTTTTLPTSVTNLYNNMITVNGGTFTMGCTPKQLQYNGDGYSCNVGTPSTQQVTLSTYKICKFEVTQQLWVDVMGSNPSYFNGGIYGTNLQRPVEQVSWNDCQAFITRLNQLTSKNYRLPTEAEWEFAARGGNNNDSYYYSGSDNLDSVAWYSSNSGNTRHAVGTKQANQLGLYDMSGNVWEWCSDWYGNYSSSAVTNPIGTASGSSRVVRGNWYDAVGYERVSHRNNHFPSSEFLAVGFRLVLTP